MLLYLLRRLRLVLVTCLFISVLAFVIIRLPPGDLVDANLAASGSTVSNEQAEAMQRDHGLDQPALARHSS